MAEYDEDERERKNVSRESVPLVNPRISFVDPTMKKFDGIIRFEDREDIYRTMKDLYGMIQDGDATKKEVIKALEKTIDMFEMSENVKKSLKGMIEDLKESKGNPGDKRERLKKVRGERGLSVNTNPNEHKVLVETDAELNVGDYIVPEGYEHPREENAIQEIKEIEERDGKRYDLIVESVHYYRDVATEAWDEKVDEYNAKKVYDYYMVNPRGWYGEPRRHAAAAKGVETVIRPGVRADMSKYVYQPAFRHPERPGYSSQDRRHAHSGKGAESVLEEGEDGEYKRLRFDKYVRDPNTGEGLERFRANPPDDSEYHVITREPGTGDVLFDSDEDFPAWYKEDQDKKFDREALDKYLIGEIIPDPHLGLHHVEVYRKTGDGEEEVDVDVQVVLENPWTGESRRHAASAKGVETVIRPGVRADMSKYVRQPAFRHPERPGYSSQDRRHAHSGKGAESVLDEGEDYKRLRFDKYVEEEGTGEGLERFKENPHMKKGYAHIEHHRDEYQLYKAKKFYEKKYGKEHVAVRKSEIGGNFYGDVYVDDDVVEDEDISPHDNPRGWHGDPRRKSLASRGIETVVEPGKRIDVSKFVDEPSWVPPGVGYARQIRRHGHSGSEGESVIPPTEAQEERGEDDYKRLRFDKFVYDEDTGKGLERFNPGVSPGDRIELVSIEDPYTRLSKGDMGTVERISRTPRGEKQIWVDWDSGGNLALLEGIDDYKVVEENPDNRERTLFKSPKYEKYADIVSMESPQDARESVSKLEEEWEDSQTRDKKVRLIRVANYTANRARVLSERDDWSQEARDKMGKVADIYRGFVDKHKGDYEENPSDNFVEVKTSYDDYDDFQEEVEYYVDKYGEDNVNVDADVHPRGGGTFHGYIYVNDLVVKDEDVYRGNPKNKKKSLRDNPTGLEVFSMLGFAGWAISEMSRYIEKERGEEVKVNPPQPIKSEAKGDYTHYRFEEPDKFDMIRIPDWAENVAESIIDGAKVRMGKLKDSGDWVPQSVLIPKEVAGKEDAIDIVSKIANNPPDDVRVPIEVERAESSRVSRGRGTTTDDYDDTNWREVRNLENTVPGMQKRIQERYSDRYGRNNVDLVDDKLFVCNNPRSDNVAPQDVSNLRENMPEDWLRIEEARLLLKDVSRQYNSRDEAYKTHMWRRLMSQLKSLPESDFKDKIIRKVNRGRFDDALSDMMSELQRMKEEYDIKSFHE